ncbi:YifB family Mg chelatase-like AAA ATPase [Carboxydochorda subterranea]|uniref:YifB family Mg chelatase-like AAA ATPase n=1 Tax=Carboxydichorda subterranea TaxID=3109565 RepID=A0ABZ1C0S6_9FIRM|nr:YifB family Mg chelatase-like AAA ATPase [Limnochorda sp. L945t]WRP18435.1 YifB family Mg chelatase-like AAA ATPase [Limnochorda sp. L945t]
MVGIEGRLVDVEAHIGPGLPDFRIVGLPDASVRESRDRVRAALRQIGLSLPAGRITVNLAPARLRKGGGSLDLAIACAVAGACEKLPGSTLRRSLLLGELALDGTLRSVDGLVPLLVEATRHPGLRIVIPEGGRPIAEALDVRGWVACPSLEAAIQVLRGSPPASLSRVQAPRRGHPGFALPDPKTGPRGGLEPEDMADVRGQALARRAAEIAAAGLHHLMLLGPPGSGKTMLARRMVGILPPLTRQEWLEVLQTYSAAGRLHEHDPELRPWHPWARRPIRAPHHTCTTAGLIGGGARISPGELTLAHRGLIFLDEFSELPPETANALREPMEEGWVTLTRGPASARLPAQTLVVAAANPCPCGLQGAPRSAGECRCSRIELVRYRRRLGGPVADRFALWVWMRPVEEAELVRHLEAEPSWKIRERVILARERQRRRLEKAGFRMVPFGRSPVNGQLTARELTAFCPLDPRVEEAYVRLGRQVRVSARGMANVLAVARTIADLEGAERIGVEHMREAFQYRRSGGIE